MKVKSQNSKVKITTKKSKLFNFALWFFLFTFSFLLLNVSCAQKEGLGMGDAAPDFTLEDVKGASVNLNKTVKANSATLLVFWTTWCPYCREEIPELRKLNADYKVKGLKILSINIGESKQKVDAFIKQQGMDYTVLLDTDSRVANQYGVTGIPTNILLDNNGAIKYRGTRPPSEELLPRT